MAAADDDGGSGSFEGRRCEGGAVDVRGEIASLDATGFVNAEIGCRSPLGTHIRRVFFAPGEDQHRAVAAAVAASAAEDTRPARSIELLATPSL